MASRTKIVRIGNSKGIRVPKALLDQAQLPEDVEIYAEPGKLVVRAVHEPRAGWAEAAAEMRRSGDDQLLERPTPTRFDEQEWVW